MQIVEQSIGRAVGAVAAEHPDNEALVHIPAGIRWTYRQLMEESGRVAAGLLRAGMRAGDKAALWAPNVAEWMLSLLALCRIGAVTVPIDPGVDKDGLLYILAQSECSGMILAAGMGGGEAAKLDRELRQQAPRLEKLIEISAAPSSGRMSLDELKTLGAEADAGMLARAEAAVDPRDPVAIMYTSGTTGRPKGVVLDHLGLINKSLASTRRQGIGPTDRLCLFFPLFHMFGNTCIALAGLLRAAALVMPCVAFDPARILAAIEAEKCTALYASPSMLIALLEHPDFRSEHWAPVKKGIIGGAPCPMELMRRLVEQVGVSDITVGYGITETASWITMTRPGDPIELRVSTVGDALECCRVKVVDPATGDDLPPGRPGEICTRGFLMKEYYKMPGATAAAVDRDGWFHTGDLGEMDERGYLRVTGRLKDVIRREDAEIYPVELEEIVYRLPPVAEVQVFGFPHPHKGQEVAVWLKPRPGAKLDLEQVAEHLRRHSPVEIDPRYLKIVDAFPMTRSGKVQKFKLAQMAGREYGSA